MNVQEYISSGILEAYVLGELSREEAQEVERLSSEYQEIKVELTKIEMSLEEVAMATAIQPANHLKSSILSQVEGEQPIPATSERPESREDKIRTLPNAAQNNGVWKFAVAAAVALAVVASVFAVYYRSQWKVTQNHLNTMIAQNQSVARDYNTVNQKFEQIEKNFNIVNDASFKKVALRGTDNSPESLANVYWNPTSKDVYLSIKNLKKLSREKQYQLWAIVDGQPVNAGVFDTQGSFLLKMEAVGGASAFAVTVESRGGSETPSLETMQVMGAVDAV